LSCSQSEGCLKISESLLRHHISALYQDEKLKTDKSFIDYEPGKGVLGFIFSNRFEGAFTE
jgi:hypothetical protein